MELSECVWYENHNIHFFAITYFTLIFLALPSALFYSIVPELRMMDSLWLSVPEFKELNSLNCFRYLYNEDYNT